MYMSMAERMQEMFCLFNQNNIRYYSLMRLYPGNTKTKVQCRHNCQQQQHSYVECKVFQSFEITFAIANILVPQLIVIISITFICYILNFCIRRYDGGLIYNLLISFRIFLTNFFKNPFSFIPRPIFQIVLVGIRNLHKKWKILYLIIPLKTLVHYHEEVEYCSQYETYSTTRCQRNRYKDDTKRQRQSCYDLQ